MRHHFPHLALGLGLAALFLWRLPLAYQYLGFTSDMGSYLMTRNYVLGHDPTGHMLAHFRPPLIGVALLPFTWAWGDLMGSKLLAILASVLVAVPFYCLARRFMSPWTAAVAALGLASFPVLMGDILAGGYLTLLATALALWGLKYLLDILHGAGGRAWVLLAVFTVLVAGMNQTVTLLYGLIALAIIVSAPGSRRRGLCALAAATLAATVWLPFYLPHLPPPRELYAEGVPLLLWTPSLTPLVLWALCAAGTAVAPGRNRYFILPATVLLLTSSASSGDALINNLLHRATYLMPPFTVLSIAATAEHLYAAKGWHRPALPIAAVLAAAVLAAAGLGWRTDFHRTATAIDILNPDNLAALEYLRQNTPYDAKVLAHPMGLAWYVGGLVPRNWSGSWYLPLAGYKGEYDAFRCTLGWRDGCDPYMLRDRYGIDYILVDEDSVQSIHNMPPGGWRITRRVPWLRELFSRGRVVVYGWN